MSNLITTTRISQYAIDSILKNAKTIQYDGQALLVKDSEGDNYILKITDEGVLAGYYDDDIESSINGYNGVCYE